MNTINPISEIEVNDVFVNSWGYDQTNIDFYQVVRKTAKCIFIRPISAKIEETGFMSGKSTPLLNKFKGDEIKKVPYKYTHDTCLKDIYVNFEYGCGSKWDGTPESCSWYA